LLWGLLDFKSSELLFGGILGAVLGISMLMLSKRLKPSKDCVFDRESGTIAWYKWQWSNKHYDFPFDEIEGRVVKSVTGRGIGLYQLWLNHLPSRTLMMLIETGAGGTDVPLGYWSFLVQYMDKTKTLPSPTVLKRFSTSHGEFSSKE